MDGIVYLITNTINGKKYVGSTTKTLEERMRGHTEDMNRKNKSHYPLYKDMKTHGITAFTIDTIMTMKYFDIKELWMVEDAYIAIHDSINNGYNMKFNSIQHKRQTYKPYKRSEASRKRDKEMALIRWHRNKNIYNERRRKKSTAMNTTH